MNLIFIFFYLLFFSMTWRSWFGFDIILQLFHFVDWVNFWSYFLEFSFAINLNVKGIIHTASSTTWKRYLSSIFTQPVEVCAVHSKLLQLLNIVCIVQFLCHCCKFSVFVILVHHVEEFVLPFILSVSRELAGRNSCARHDFSLFWSSILALW